MSPIRFVLLLCCAPTLARAQGNPYPDLTANWQRNRATVLAYIDAMPDSTMGFGLRRESGPLPSSSTTS